MEDELKKQAEEFARVNKKRLAKEITDITKYAPDDIPVSVFMAGSPGAGKTEYSKNLIQILEENKKHKVIRIDGDELRQYIPGYSGKTQNLRLSNNFSMLVRQFVGFGIILAKK